MTTGASSHPFVRWNAKLLETFFPSGALAEDVWLALGPEELDQIAPELGGHPGLVDAVKDGPPWDTVWEGWRWRRSTVDDMHRRGIGLRDQRRGARPPAYIDPGQALPYLTGVSAPTYLPILAVLVLSGPHDPFYQHFRGALGIAGPWGPAQLERLNELWDDLSQWSTTEQEGRFGRFVKRTIGAFPNVGVPRSQSVVLRRDAARLPRVFALAGVRPGQAVTDALLNTIIGLSAGQPYLSTLYKQAAADLVYHELLRDLLRSAVEEWDGSLDDDRPGAAALRDGPGDANGSRALDVALGLGEQGDLPWSVGFRVEGRRDAGRIVLHGPGGRSWEGRLSGLPMATAMPVPGTDGAAVLDVAGTTEFSVEIDGKRDGTVSYRRRALRYLIQEDQGAVLVEHGYLPGHGVAYLLCPPENLGRLQHLLREHQVGLVPCAGDGLPSGWTLWAVPDCAEVHARQCRLPDGADAPPQPRHLRLVGGVRSRLGGRVVFLAYDLPLVELDGPPGSWLEADGLAFDERRAQAAPAPLLRGSTIRRFGIDVRAPGRSGFLLRAVAPNGDVLQQVALRLSTEGVFHYPASLSGLDRTGEPTLNGPRLLGVHLEDKLPRAPHARLGAPPSGFGSPLSDTELARIKQRPEALFLDALAQSVSGYLPYGRARDLLNRLLFRTSDPEPALVLRRLRRRGFLEILTDARGRWARVVAARPCVYTLPMGLPRGESGWAVGGTVALSQWEHLSRLGTARWVSGLDGAELPAVRLVGPLAEEATRLGFLAAVDPATEVVHWAASIDDVRARLATGGRSTLGYGLERYSPFVADWMQGGAVAQGADWELLRLDDPDTGRHLLHSIAHREAGAWKYRFLWDERWGSWIARTAWGRWARQTLGVDAADPWPLHYEPGTGSLWVPARMNVPHVLERALVLCSGGPPHERRLSRGPDREDDRVTGVDPSRWQAGAFSTVYGDFLPAEPIRAAWLAYERVPLDVAIAVAERLDCRIEVLLQ